MSNNPGVPPTTRKRIKIQKTPRAKHMSKILYDFFTREGATVKFLGINHIPRTDVAVYKITRGEIMYYFLARVCLSEGEYKTKYKFSLIYPDGKLRMKQRASKGRDIHIMFIRRMEDDDLWDEAKYKERYVDDSTPEDIWF